MKARPVLLAGLAFLTISANSAVAMMTPVPVLAAPDTATFQIEEATIEGIQSAILKGDLTSTRVVQLYLDRIKAYDGPCVDQPQGALGPFTTIKHAGQINALITLNLRPASRSAQGFGPRKARSMTDAADNSADMPDALEVAAKQDAYFKSTGKLIGPLHGIVFSVKDWYDTFDMRTTAGLDVAYANDRPPHDATFITRLRDAGGIILAKANVGSPNVGSRSPFGGVSCNPYDTERSAGTSSSGSGIVGGRQSGHLLDRRRDWWIDSASDQEQQCRRSGADPGTGQSQRHVRCGIQHARRADLPHRPGCRARARRHRRLRPEG